MTTRGRCWRLCPPRARGPRRGPEASRRHVADSPPSAHATRRRHTAVSFDDAFRRDLDVAFEPAGTDGYCLRCAKSSRPHRVGRDAKSVPVPGMKHLPRARSRGCLAALDCPLPKINLCVQIGYARWHVPPANTGHTLELRLRLNSNIIRRMKLSPPPAKPPRGGFPTTAQKRKIASCGVCSEAVPAHPRKFGITFTP